MTAVYIKLGIGVSLFLTWLALVVFAVPGTVDIILAIKAMLVGLGAYHLNDRVNAPTLPPPPAEKPSNPEGGYASVAFLISLVFVTFIITGCSGLHVSWVATASYNTPATTQATLTTGAEALPAVPK